MKNDLMSIMGIAAMGFMAYATYRQNSKMAVAYDAWVSDNPEITPEINDICQHSWMSGIRWYKKETRRHGACYRLCKDSFQEQFSFEADVLREASPDAPAIAIGIGAMMNVQRGFPDLYKALGGRQ